MVKEFEDKRAREKAVPASPARSSSSTENSRVRARSKGSTQGSSPKHSASEEVAEPPKKKRQSVAPSDNGDTASESVAEEPKQTEEDAKVSIRFVTPDDCTLHKKLRTESFYVAVFVIHCQIKVTGRRISVRFYTALQALLQSTASLTNTA